MSQKPRNAFLIVLYALAVGLIYALPHFWFWQDAGKEWGFPHFNMPDELGAYAGRVRALYNGEELGAASQTLACPDEDTQFPAAGEYVTYGLARLFGLGIRGCFILADFLLPALSVLGFYLFLRALGCSPRLSRLGPLTLYLLDPILVSRGPLVALFQTISAITGKEIFHHWNCTFILSRMISPEAAMPLFAFACYATARMAWGGRWIWAVPAGVLLGLAAAVHLSVGLPFLIGIFLFGLGTLVTRKVPFPRFVLMGLCTVAVLAPRVLQLLDFFKSPGSQWVVDRQATLSHSPMGLGYVLIMGFYLVPFLLLYRRKRDLTFWFFLSIIVGNLVCMNLQVLSGSDFGIAHYYGYSFVPMTWLAYFVGFSRWAPSLSIRILAGHPRLRARVVEACLCFYAVVNGTMIQQAHYHADELQWVKPTSRWLAFQSLEPVFRWLDENATTQDVVVSSPETVDLYAIYSPAKVLAQFMLQMCPYKVEDYVDRYLLPFKLYGCKWAAVEPIAKEMVYDIHMTAESWRSGTWAQADRPPRLQKPDVIALMKEHYDALPVGEALDRMLRDLRVKYVIFGEFEKELPGASPDALLNDHYRLRFESNGHRIYELLPM